MKTTIVRFQLEQLTKHGWMQSGLPHELLEKAQAHKQYLGTLFPDRKFQIVRVTTTEEREVVG